MNTHEEGPPDEEATTAANSLAGILLLGQMEAEAEAKGIATDTATLNSDAAVGGSVGGGSGEKNRSTSTSNNNNGSGGGGSITPPEAAPPEATNKSNSNARQRHYRTRFPPRPVKTGLLQSLLPQTKSIALPVQYPYPVSSTITEYKQVF